MKVPKEINKLLSNKYVLYVVAFLSLTNVIAYLVAQDYNSLLFFAIIGYLVSYFSKNMTVILLCALIITNLLMTAKSIQNQSGMRAQREGMGNIEVDVGGTGDKKKKEEEDAKKAKGGAGTQPKPPVSNVSPTVDKPETKKKQNGGVDSSQPATTGKEDFDIAALAGGLGKTMENVSPNQIGGKDMNKEAGDLLRSQEVLAENLKTMGPLLETAKGMMDTLSGSEGMLSKLGMIGGLM